MVNTPANAVVWVAGGREYPNRSRVFEVLDRYHKNHGIRIVVTGACKKKSENKDDAELSGADRWAQEWAIAREIPYVGYSAKWSTEGNAAGPKRNERIALGYIVQIDCLIAFPGDRGTRDAVQKAEAASKPVYKIDWK